MAQEMSNAAAIAKFFGKKPGQNLTDLMAEVKQLTESDKEELGPLCRAALAESPVADAA